MKKIDMAFSDLSGLPLERRWHEQVYPAPIVVALIRRELRQRDSAEIEPHYLLIKRKSRPYDGHWALVGGKWDFGEAEMRATIGGTSADPAQLIRFERVEGHGFTID